MKKQTYKELEERKDNIVGIMIFFAICTFFFLICIFILASQKAELLEENKQLKSQINDLVGCEDRYVGYGMAYCYPNKNDCKYIPREDGMWDIYEKCEVIE